jgi:membrane protease YdiL (CAAX protease family)
MRSIANPEALERKAMRTDVRAVAIALIGYLVITSFMSIIMVFIAGFIVHGVVYIASSFVGLGFIWFCFKSEFYLGDILYVQRRIPPKVLVNAIVCAIGIQPVFLLTSRGVELGFNKAGYQITFETAVTQGEGMAFLLLNSILFAPVIEEILFRGVVLRLLSRYGRNFSMLTSAILFGLYSTDFIEFFHGFALGLLLAYITFRYSIKWAVVIHCAHNLIWDLADALQPPWYFVYGFLAIFFVWGIIIAALKFRKVRRFVSKGRSVKNGYKYFFTAPAVLLYMAIALALAAMGSSVIPLDQVKPVDSPLTTPLV